MNNTEYRDIAAQKRFKELFSMHYQKIVYYAQSFLHNPEDAESVAQEVFASAWEKIETLNDESLPYLIVITKRKCLNIINREKYKKSHKDYVVKSYYDMKIASAALRETCIENLLSEEAYRIYLNSLNSLPARTREAFTLSRQKNMTYKDIAEIQGVSIKNIEYRISQALSVLRRNLKDYLPLILGATIIYLSY